MRFGLTRYGMREVAILTASCGALVVLAAAVWPPSAALPVAVWALALAFFRDPERRPDEPDALLSPADGKIVDVSPLGEDSPLGAPGTRIGIFMGLLDVHVNRSPCAGTVTRVCHFDGGHADARAPLAGEHNESATVALSVSRSGRTFVVLLRQVAGLIARRIVTDLKPGQAVAPGQRIGMIKFGSRVELLVPQGLIGQLAVRLGQTVRAGKTVLVRPPAPEERP